MPRLASMFPASVFKHLSKQRSACPILLYDDIIKKENRSVNYLNRAECYIAVGKYQEAQNDLSEAQKLDPKSSDLYLLKARMAQMQFRYDDAYGYAMEAVKLGCDKSQALPYLKKKDR